MLDAPSPPRLSTSVMPVVPMPNCDPNLRAKELPKLELFFARIAPAITRFAERHSLSIQRYYDDLPSWQLCFDHPRDGSAYVEVRQEGPGSFVLLSVWWVDSAGTRFCRSASSGPYCVRGTNVESLLQRHYTSLLRWLPGRWDLVSPEEQ